MTPTLLSASSATYLATPAATSDNLAAPVDGSAVSAPASDETSHDRRDDVAPSDFAVLLAAMMAPAARTTLPPRVDPADAKTSSAASPAVGDATAATSAGLAMPVALSASAGATSGSDPLAVALDTPSTSHPAPSAPPTTSTGNTQGSTAVAGSATAGSATAGTATGGTATAGIVTTTAATAPLTDSLVAEAVPGGADRTGAQTPTSRTQGFDPSSVDAATEPVPASSLTTERKSPAPSLGLVALDRPLSLGRRVTMPSPPAVEVSVAVPLAAAGLAAAAGPEAAMVSGEASAAKAPAVPAERDAVSTLSAVPAGAAPASPSAPLGARLVPGSGNDEALAATSAEDGGAPMSIETNGSPTASTAASQNGTGGENNAAVAAASEALQSVSVARPTHVSLDEPSASSDEDADPSPVGASAGTGQASLTERPTSVEGPTLSVVEGVRPGEASQQIVRAAQRAQAVGGTQHMRLEMHPGDLGAVAVEVTIEGGTVHVAMVAERGETKDLLRSSIGELRSSLVAAGFSAGRVDIQSGLSDGRFGQPADRHDPWSQSFDRPDSRRDQSGSFANMFDQSSGSGDQARSSRAYSEAGDRGDSGSALRGMPSSDRIVSHGATTSNGDRRDRLDLQL